MSNGKRKIVLIVHNVRSAHNVGSILRSADGFGIDSVYLTGYTPYPASPNDQRLPYQAQRADYLIHKTALGAEKYVNWSHQSDVITLLHQLRKDGFLIVALELTSSASDLAKFKPRKNMAIILGSELAGVDKKLLSLADRHLKIPMAGQKESLNVSAAAAIAMYHLRRIT